MNYFWNRFHSLSTNKNETGFLQARLQFLGFGGTKKGLDYQTEDLQLRAVGLHMNNDHAGV